MSSKTSPPRPTLLIFDFDETLINLNSDLLPFKSPDFVPYGVPLLDHLWLLSKKLGPGSWTRMMRIMLAVLARVPGYSRGDFVQCLRSVRMDEVLKGALRTLVQHSGGEGDTDERSIKGFAVGPLEMVIASDANQVFISEILDANELGDGVFSGVHTNSAEWTTEAYLSDEDERLVQGILADLKDQDIDVQSTTSGSTDDGPARWEPSLHVRPFQSPESSHGCNRCAANMCKSTLVSQAKRDFASRLSLLDDNTADLELRIRVVYAGDGHNDYCPALSLRPGDVLLAREGYSLAKKLARDTAKDAEVQKPGMGVPDTGRTDHTSSHESEQASDSNHGKEQRVVAEILFWKIQEELGRLLLEVFDGGSPANGQDEDLQRSVVSSEEVRQLAEDFRKKAVL